MEVSNETSDRAEGAPLLYSSDGDGMSGRMLGFHCGRCLVVEVFHYPEGCALQPCQFHCLEEDLMRDRAIRVL